MKEALSFDPPEPDPHWNQDFTNHILAVAMDRIRGEFEPETWNAFEAAWVRQEPPSQIAARLGTAIHTIYVNKSRVLKRGQELGLTFAPVLHAAKRTRSPYS